MSSSDIDRGGPLEKLPKPVSSSKVPSRPTPPPNGLVRIDPAHAAPTALSAAPNAVALLKALRRRWLLATILAPLAAVVVGAAVWVFLPPPKQTAYTKLYMPARPEAILFEHPEGRGDFSSFQRTQVALIKSRLVLNAAIKDPKVVALNGDDINKRPYSAAWLENKLKVEFPDGPEISRISIAGDNAEQVKVLVSAVTDAYLREIVNKQTTHRQERLDQLREIEAKFQARFNRIKKAHDELAKVAGPDEKARSVKQEMLEKQRGLAQSEFIKSEADLRRLELEKKMHEVQGGDAAKVPHALLDQFLEKDPGIQRLLALREQLEEKLEAERRLFQNPDGRPSVQRVLNAIKENRQTVEAKKKQLRPQALNKLKKDSQSQRQLLEEQIKFHEEFCKLLKEEVERLAKEADMLNVRALDLRGFELDLDLAKDGLKRVRGEIDKLTVELQAPPRVTKLEDATVLRVDELPRKMKMAGGGAGGAFGLMLLLVAFLEFRARRIDAPEEVVHGLGMRLMGTLPAPPRRLGRGLIHSSSAVASHWQHMLAESVDSARTLLLRASAAGPMRVVMVTSATSGEGKTSLATHLAASLARAGRKTVLLDGDLRKPAAHRVFESPQGPGFCEALRGEVELAQALHATPAPGLSLMPAGRCDSETLQLLAQGGVQKVLDDLKSHYDFIVVDTAPVLPVADSLLIAQHVDGVLFSLLREVSRLPKVYAAYQRLALLGVPLVGAVVNGTDEDPYVYGQHFPVVTRA